MAEMVQLITQRGPKVDEISRMIGVHNETVRHWYRQLLNRGFVIQASCNYESLGMKRIVAVVELGEQFRGMADVIFYVLNQSAFLMGYAKTGRGGSYVLNVSVPSECIDRWADLMTELKRTGVFGSIQSVTLDWVRNLPMQAEDFDFETGRWRLNPKGARPQAGYSDEKPSLKQKYDTTDLKIIGQLQVDANMSLVKMCENVGETNYKTFTWHFREHVFRRHLIKGYRVNWTGMQYAGRKQKYSWLDVMASDLPEDRRLELATKLNASPFVWMEGAGPRTYYTRMVFPSESAPQVLEQLEKAVASNGDTVRWFRMNPSHSIYFSMETGNYDQEKRRWNLKKEKVMETFASLGRVRHQALSGKAQPGQKTS